MIVASLLVDLSAEETSYISLHLDDLALVLLSFLHQLVKLLFVLHLHLVRSVGQLRFRNAWLLVPEFLRVRILVLIVAAQLLVTHYE